MRITKKIYFYKVYSQPKINSIKQLKFLQGIDKKIFCLEMLSELVEVVLPYKIVQYNIIIVCFKIAINRIMKTQVVKVAFDKKQVGSVTTTKHTEL